MLLDIRVTKLAGGVLLQRPVEHLLQEDSVCVCEGKETIGPLNIYVASRSVPRHDGKPDSSLVPLEKIPANGHEYAKTVKEHEPFVMR